MYSVEQLQASTRPQDIQKAEVSSEGLWTHRYQQDCHVEIWGAAKRTVCGAQSRKMVLSQAPQRGREEELPTLLCMHTPLLSLRGLPVLASQMPLTP